MKYYLTFGGMIVVAGFCFFFIATCGSRIECSAQWGDSGVQHRYSAFGGCQLSEDQGKTWIPSDRYRKVD